MSKKTVGTKINGKVDAIEWVAKKGYPEVGTFTDQKVLQKFYKQLPTETLEDWAKVEGVEYKVSDNESIHRMRVCMSILYLHFPKEVKATAKPKSKYADLSTEELIKMAIEHDLVLDVCDDMRIMRMRAIVGLRNIKVID